MSFAEQQKTIIKENQHLINTLKECWKGITFLNQKLRIFKEDRGMNRGKEMLIHRSREKIMEARTLIEQVIEDSKSKIKESNILLAKTNYYQNRNEKRNKRKECGLNNGGEMA